MQPCSCEVDGCQSTHNSKFKFVYSVVLKCRLRKHHKPQGGQNGKGGQNGISCHDGIEN